jgi:hypothetical protein
MAESCEPSDLASASKCFQCLSDKENMAIQAYLLAVIAGGSTDPEVLLAAAKDFSALDEKSLALVQAYLLCQISA